MKVLTVKQPWATLIANGNKRVEFRSWKTNYRGSLLIHAGKRRDEKGIKRLQKYLPAVISKGEIIAQVTLKDCILIDEELNSKLKEENIDIYGTNNIGYYAWILEGVTKLDKPIQINGKLSLWDYEGK
jgi:hypothetical protein